MLNPENIASGSPSPQPLASLGAPTPEGQTPRPVPSSLNDDRVTVVLFKDHHPPRSFEVTLGWVRKMGLLLGALVLVTTFSVSAALRFGWIARTSRPEALKRMQEENKNLRTMTESLEEQVSDLQEQAKLSQAEPAETQPDSPLSTEGSPAPQVSETPTLAMNESPLQKGTTATPEPPQAEMKEKVPDSKPVRALFDRIWARLWEATEPRPATDSSRPSASPSTAGVSPIAVSAIAPGIPLFVPASSWSDGLPTPAQLKISITPATTQLKGSRLSVKFAIQYTADDGKNQQGRIVLLARGPSGVLAYPEGVLNGMESSTLISPERGEFFSVSRYREVATQFDLPASKASSWKEIEVMIFQPNEKILVHQKIDLAQSASPQSGPAIDQSKTRPAAKPALPNESDTLMSPGVDR